MPTHDDADERHPARPGRTPVEAMSDADLRDRIRDDGALRELAVRHHDVLFGQILAAVDDPTRAQHILERTFVVARRRSRRQRRAAAGTTVESWLAALAGQQCAGEQRSETTVVPRRLRPIDRINGITLAVSAARLARRRAWLAAATVLVATAIVAVVL